MKKIFTLLLCVALLASMLSLVSCQQDIDDGPKYSETLNGKTPEELYEFSQEKLKQATSYSVQTTQVIEMTYGGESYTMNQTVESKVNGDNSYSKSNNDMDSMASFESWYVDGICYTKMYGYKFKTAISKDEYMEEYMEVDPSESTLLDIPESWFENVKFEKVGNDNVLKFVVSGDKYTELFGNLGLGSITIVGNVDYSIYFDDAGNLNKLVSIFDMMVEGVSAHCESVSIITIGAVTITPPPDASSYEWVDL